MVAAKASAAPATIFANPTATAEYGRSGRLARRASSMGRPWPQDVAGRALRKPEALVASESPSLSSGAPPPAYTDARAESALPHCCADLDSAAKYDRDLLHRQGTRRPRWQTQPLRQLIASWHSPPPPTDFVEPQPPIMQRTGRRREYLRGRRR
jgi:hypothetical protein